MAAQTRPLTLLTGNGHLRCPGCEATGSIGQHFKPLDKNERYGEQLATVYRHRRDRGGCGHVFAPLVPHIPMDYVRLNGSREEAYTT